MNMLFVRPLIQHLGFFRADGWFAARRTLTLLAIAALCYGLLTVCVVSGWYAPDMPTNLNPPTLCMVLLGAAQACVLQVCTPALNRIMRGRVAQTVVGVVVAAGSPGGGTGCGRVGGVRRDHEVGRCCGATRCSLT